MSVGDPVSELDLEREHPRAQGDVIRADGPGEFGAPTAGIPSGQIGVAASVTSAAGRSLKTAAVGAEGSHSGRAQDRTGHEQEEGVAPSDGIGEQGTSWMLILSRIPSSFSTTNE